MNLGKPSPSSSAWWQRSPSLSSSSPSSVGPAVSAVRFTYTSLKLPILNLHYNLFLVSIYGIHSFVSISFTWTNSVTWTTYLQANAKSMQDGHLLVQIGSVGGFGLKTALLHLSFLSFRVSFVMSLSLEKQREAMLKWCKLKGVPCADMHVKWRFHPVPPTQLVLGSHDARYIFSKNNKLCGLCLFPIYILIYSVLIMEHMIQHCASLCRIGVISYGRWCSFMYIIVIIINISLESVWILLFGEIEIYIID